MPMPRDASALGSTWIRTAYFCGAVNLHLRDAADHRDALAEIGPRRIRRPSKSATAWSRAQIQNRLIGRIDLLDRRAGSASRAAVAIEPRRSPPARPAPRRRGCGFRSNCRVILVEPWILVELIELRPAIVENCFSSGVATEDAIVSGLAPGSAGADHDGREVDVGEIVDRQISIRHQAEDDDRERDQRRHDRAADEDFGEIHEAALCTPVSAFLDHHLTAGNQAQLSVGDHGLASAQAAFDHGIAFDSVADRDGADRSFHFRIDDEHIGAVISGLHRLTRHQHRIGTLTEGQVGIDELAGPELLVADCRRVP